jgi:hypothetical protein
MLATILKNSRTINFLFKIKNSLLVNLTKNKWDL